MSDATRTFVEAYGSEQRRRQQHGMDNNGDFDPANNPYAHGRDPDDVQWDDEDFPSPEEEGEIARREKASLDAALKQARADEGEDEDEAEDESEDEDESE